MVDVTNPILDEPDEAYGELDLPELSDDSLSTGSWSMDEDLKQAVSHLGRNELETVSAGSESHEELQRGELPARTTLVTGEPKHSHEVEKESFDTDFTLSANSFIQKTVQTVLNDDTTFEDYYDNDDELEGFDIDEVLATAIDYGASDVHVNADDTVAFTIRNDIHRIDKFGKPSPVVLGRLARSLISNVLEADFNETFELDTSYVLRSSRHAGRRTRLNIGRSFGVEFLVFRVVADVIPTPDQLGVPDFLLEWFDSPRGLVMVNGPTGTGKTTTIASLVQNIQMTTPKKIITVEKPIEFIYGVKGRSLVVQREVGIDSRSFNNSLTSAMRQKPDVILVGEVRNREEFSELLRAAESGHFSVSTMHTYSAPATLNRIRSLFDGDEQRRILSTLADVSVGFANQVLLKTPDGKQMFAVHELLPVDYSVRSLIREGDVSGLRQYQIDHEFTMEHALAKVVNEGRATFQEARRQATDRHLFDSLSAKL